MTDILLLTCLFLVAGTLAVPLAIRFKLGSVLGYIIAGIVISPMLAAFKVDVSALQHFAEFGVVMMLFLVGLELEPRLLWQMKNKLVGLGGDASRVNGIRCRSSGYFPWHSLAHRYSGRFCPFPIFNGHRTANIK